MMLFEKATENADAVRQVGARALAEAKRVGVPAYYLDRSLGEGLIREMPDGTRHRIETVAGVDVVVESFGPRA